MGLLTEPTARSVARRIAAAAAAAAAEQGTPQRSWWDSIKDTAARSRDVLVDVAKVVVAVLDIVVLIIGGPLAWVVLAAALIVLADTLYEYSQGRATAGDLAWSLPDCIPGVKGLTTTAKLAGALATLGDTKKVLALGKTAIRSAASAERATSCSISTPVPCGGSSFCSPHPRRLVGGTLRAIGFGAPGDPTGVAPPHRPPPEEDDFRDPPAVVRPR